MFTAGHCGKTGDKFSFESHDIGVFQTEYSPENSFSDWGMIQLDSDIGVGGNLVTGDKIVDDIDLVSGTEMCRLAMNQSVSCGQVLVGPADGVVIGTPHLHGVPGDSGGPVWSGDKFVGIYTGYWLDGTVSIVRVPSEFFSVHQNKQLSSDWVLSS